MPEPAMHHCIRPYPIGPESPRCLHQAVQQPVADDVQAMVVHAAVHEIANHQVVLNRHQSFGMNGQVSVRGQGHRSEDPVQIELSIARAGAVAVAHEIVQTVTVKLAADESPDHRAIRFVVFEQVGHGIRQTVLQQLEGATDGWMGPNHLGRPGFMAKAEHLLA